MTNINIGIIGAGRMGNLHNQHVTHRLSGADVRAVADVELEAAQRLATEHGIPHAFEDYRRILDDPEIDAVLILTRSDSHAHIVEEVATAGKHIFCEKPLGIDLGQVDRALAAVDRAGIKLQVGFQRRFDPNFLRARELVDAGEIGTPHIVRITSRDPKPPTIEYLKTSGGLFLNMTVHDFDMARWVVDGEVAEVFAVGGALVDPEIGRIGDIDTAIINLTYDSGAYGIIDNSRQAVYGYDQRVEVFGSEGMVVVANRERDTTELSTAEGIVSATPVYFFKERYIDAYIAEMRAFIECLQQDQMPSVTGVDGRAAVVMGYAARMSYEENRPVELSAIKS